MSAITVEEIKDFLSKVLGLPGSLVLDSDDSLSRLCLIELSSLLELPVGYVLTDSVRVPNKGDYFLDVKKFINDNRIVVSKAIGPLSSVGLIVKKDENKSDTHSNVWDFSHDDGSVMDPNSEGEIDFEFDFTKCEEMNGLAVYEGELVEVLAPYVDPEGSIAIIIKASGVTKKVPVVQLRNLKPSDFKFLKDESSDTSDDQEEPSGYYAKTPSPGKVDSSFLIDRMLLKFDLPFEDDWLNF